MKIELTTPEFNAVLAGLRLLATALLMGEVSADDGGVGDILADSDEGHLDADEIDTLADNMQTWS